MKPDLDWTETVERSETGHRNGTWDAEILDLGSPPPSITFFEDRISPIDSIHHAISAGVICSAVVSAIVLIVIFTFSACVGNATR